MGLKRVVGNRSFIDSVLDTFDDFYGDVVQHLKEWQPAAPKLQKSKEEETDARPVLSTTEHSSEPIDNSLAEKEAVSTGPSSMRKESNE